MKLTQTGVSQVKRGIWELVKYIDVQVGIREHLRPEEPPIEERPGAFLAGDRAIENAWMVEHLPQPPASLLDVGSGHSPISAIAASLGHSVTAIDISPISWSMSSVEFLQGDFLELDLGNRKYDSVCLCSSIEHFGLSGRFDAEEDPTADLKAMSRVRNLMAPHGKVSLTIPVGLDACFAPWHRIYGKERLPALFKGFYVVEEQYYAKPDLQVWRETDRETALSLNGSVSIYALGLYVLTREPVDDMRTLPE